MSVIKWILGGLGWAVGGPIGAILGVVLGALFDGGAKSLPSGNDIFSGAQGSDTTGQQRTSRQSSSQSDIRFSLLVLVACVMKADGHVRKSELDLVKRFLVRNYGEQGALDALKVLKAILDQELDPLAVSRQIAGHVNYSTRLELLHFLFDLANADGEFLESEERVVKIISDGLNISPADYRSLAALYNKAQDANWAYTVLEIEPGATNDEVKKAYRRMAMKYHPDKVAGAGEDIKQKATEKFRGINEAYEHIKTIRGIN